MYIMSNKTAKRGGRKLSAFNVFMKKELARLKQITPGLDHKVAFKQAAQNWKSHSSSSPSPSHSSTSKHPKKGQPSRTRKGRLDFVTHKGDKYYHRKGHRQTKNRKGKKGRPYM